MTWLTEFGAEFDVPTVIDQAVARGVMKDSSWHNDACPSFSVDWPDGGAIRVALYVEHPNPAQRELPDCKGRFLVFQFYHDGTPYDRATVETDDPREALAVFLSISECAQCAWMRDAGAMAACASHAEQPEVKQARI